MSYFKLQYLTASFYSSGKSSVKDRIFYGRNIAAFKKIKWIQEGFLPRRVIMG